MGLEMIKHILIASTLISLMAPMAFASGPGIKPIPANTDPNCITNPNDPYEPRVRMVTGRDAGVCVNSTLRRSVKALLGDEAAQYFPHADGKIVVANFSHKNKYWIAEIPLSSMTEMVLQSEHFPMVTKPIKIEIDHTQIRFSFSQPIRLVTQVTDGPRETLELHHLILSEENIGPYGEAYDFFNGAKGYFNVAYRIVSLEDKYNWMIADSGHQVSQRRFDLGQYNQISYLLEGIKRGTQYGSGRPYDSFNLNCSTEILDILNAVLGTDKFETVGFVSNKLPRMLDSLKVLDLEKMPNFNEEYKDLTK